ncbi:hypothetical protein ACFL0N_03070 [Pseudomonadota bacterium]
MKIDSRMPGRIAVVVILMGLVMLSLGIRIPYFEVFGNTDEAWYAAAAVYNNAHDLSPFGSDNNAMAYTIQLYQYSALIGGNYSKSFVDFVTLIISIIITSGIFLMINGRIGIFAALIASVLFIFVNTGFEGLTSNREWLSVIFIFIAVLLLKTWPFLTYREFKHRVIYCGFLVAFAFVMKSQSIPFLALVPALAFLWMVKCKMKKSDTFRILLWYMLALLLGFCLALTPYFLNGSVEFYIAHIFGQLFNYGIKNTIQDGGNWVSGVKMLIGYSWINTNPTSIFTGLASISCVYQLITLHRGLKSHSSNEDIGPASTITVSFILSMVCVIGGSRYVDHYYLLMLPFGIPLTIITIESLASEREGTAFLFKMFILVTIAIHALWSAMRGVDNQFISFIALLISVVITSVAYYNRDKSLNGWLFHSFCLMYCMVFGTLLLHEYHEFNPSKSTVQAEMQNVVATISGQSRPTDELFVWGWKPRLYVATGLIPATQYVSVAELVQDLNKSSKAEGKSAAMHQLISQLKLNQPKFLIDASRQSYTHSTKEIYSLSNYTQVHSFIMANYVLEGEYDDFFLYVHH